MMPDQSVRIDIDDEGPLAGVTGCEDVGRRRRAGFLAGHLGDEVRVVMLEQRHHPRLEGVPDVLGLDDGIGFGVELLLDVVQHGARTAAAPGRVVAQPMQFLRRIAQPSPGVSDLGVRREHQAVGASQRENDGHHRMVSRAGAPRPTSGRKSHRKQMQIIEDAKQPEATLAFTGKC